MFPDVSGFVNTVTSHDYNTTILIAMIVLLIMFFKFLIRLIKQILIGGTKKVLIEFFYTSAFGLLTVLLSRFL